MGGEGEDSAKYQKRLHKSLVQKFVLKPSLIYNQYTTKTEVLIIFFLFAYFILILFLNMYLFFSFLFDFEEFNNI